ncbi:MAG TPA: hypothetical protein VF263_24920, partial [Longimicrobiaceae bacterium]
IALGGVHLAEAQRPGDVTARSCYQGGSICSDGANCCVRDGTCYNTCPPPPPPDGEEVPYPA